MVALRGDPGFEAPEQVAVEPEHALGATEDGFAIRGFAGDLNTPSGYLVNGFNGGRGFGGIRDTSSIDRMEILRGPTSAIYGRGLARLRTRAPAVQRRP